MNIKSATIIGKFSIAGLFVTSLALASPQDAINDGTKMYSDDEKKLQELADTIYFRPADKMGKSSERSDDKLYNFMSKMSRKIISEKEGATKKKTWSLVRRNRYFLFGIGPVKFNLR
jgi:hypothetical protein